MTGIPSAGRSTPAAAISASLLQGGAGFLVLFIGVHAVLAATTDDLAPAEVVELVLICGPQIVVTVRRSIGPVLRAVIAVKLLAATAIACAGLPFDHDPPGYTAWQFGAISIVLLGFLLLGRYAYAFGTMAGVAAIAVAWSIWTGHGAGPGIALVDRHVATLFVGACFSVGYRRTLAAAREFRSLAGRQHSLDLAAQAQASARRAAVEVVLEQAGPMLAAIAEGRALTAADRRELVVIEGGLRDRIRATRLLSGRLPDAVAAARRRGVDVLLLDESEPPEADAHRAAADWLADRLDDTRTGRFVGRLRRELGGLHATAGSGDSSHTAAFEEPVPLSGSRRAGRWDRRRWWRRRAG